MDFDVMFLWLTCRNERAMMLLYDAYRSAVWHWDPVGRLLGERVLVHQGEWQLCLGTHVAGGRKWHRKPVWNVYRPAWQGHCACPRTVCFPVQFTPSSLSLTVVKFLSAYIGGDPVGHPDVTPQDLVRIISGLSPARFRSHDIVQLFQGQPEEKKRKHRLLIPTRMWYSVLHLFCIET